jgi:hypothetical protein
MKPEERMQAWQAIKGSKPSWESFKRLLTSSNNDVEEALKKWKKRKEQ